MNRTLILFVNHFCHTHPQRRAEIDDCLIGNASNPAISRIVVLAQSSMDERPEIPVGSEKLVWVDIDCRQRPHERPTFQDFFDEVNRCITSPYDLSIVANSDILFDDTLSLLLPYDLEGTCAALARWDVHQDSGTYSVQVWDNSQDVWIFQGRIRPLGWLDFPMGIGACDWRLAWELFHADYRLINPCYDVRAVHNHLSAVRHNGNSIGGPAEYVPRSSLDDCHLQPLSESQCGLISFSLFGSEPRYMTGAVRNAEAARHLYPGWTLRYYIDSTVSRDVVGQLRDLKAEIVMMPYAQHRYGTIWRLLAADDKGFARWIIRDADSRLNYRERRAVDEWIASGLRFHVMRDHPYHVRVIHGFGFGGIRGAVRNMASQIREWCAKSDNGNCEDFLEATLWTSVEDHALIHSAYGPFGDNTRPFPSQRQHFRFVGERCYEDEHWNHSDRWKLITG